MRNDSFRPKLKKAPTAARKTSLSLLHGRTYQEKQFFPNNRKRAAAKKTSPSLLHGRSYHVSSSEEKCLRQPGRPHQAYYIAENCRKNCCFLKLQLRQPCRAHLAYYMAEDIRNGRFFRNKIKTCGSREDLTKLITWQNI